jgi:hypothetical protein
VSNDEHDAATFDRSTLTREEAAAEVAEVEAVMAAFMARLPPEEHAAVVRGMYFDGDGQPRTRHRMLRAL